MFEMAHRTNVLGRLPILLFLSVLVVATTAAGKIIYVDADATGANDGSSWADAYTYLQDALADANLAEEPTEVLVAQGVYKPDQGDGQTPGDRNATFQLKNCVTIRGGYAGCAEPGPNVRSIKTYETILSGDIGIPGYRLDNTFHIVTTVSGTNRTAILDGSTITGGNGSRGGGMYNHAGSPTITNCIFIANSAEYGGGMFNFFSDPTVSDCTFIANSALALDIGGGIGGGMYNYSSDPTVTNCTFSCNSATCDGGGMYNTGSHPTVTNCAFSGNSATYDGGGMYNYQSRSTVANCTFSENSGRHSGGGMYNSSSYPTVTNCAFSCNSANNDRDGGGMYNLFSDPTVANCTFSENSAPRYGGGMYNFHCDLNMTNCIFSGNSAVVQGGAIYNGCKSSLTVINCTIAANFAPNGSAMACDSYQQECPSSVTMLNCIIWNGSNWLWNNDKSTISITYSDVEASCQGEGNIDVGPSFAEPGYWDPNRTLDDPNDDFWVDGDYHLKSQAGRCDPNTQTWIQDDVTSPCIDAGDMRSRIGYEPFPNGGIINMGAYGGTTEASKSYFGEPACKTIVAGDINGDCVVDFNDFALMVVHWLEEH
jgi:predicted outer membrane repeat protein